MLERIFKSRSQQTRQAPSEPVPAAARKAAPRGPTVIGEREVWVKQGTPTTPQAPQAPQAATMELVPPARGKGAGQGCWFSESLAVCVPCLTCVDHSDGLKGMICLVPVCCD